MNILIFKTNICTPKAIEDVQHLFNQHPFIEDWSVDTEDIDNVLRIVTQGVLFDKDIIELISKGGFNCQTLPD